MFLSSFKKNILGIFIFFTLSTTNSFATIVSQGDYMQDDESSLDWLKVTKTKGKSYNEILYMLATGGSLEGWRLATRSEFATLVSNWLGFTPPSSYNANSNLAALGGLINLLGKTGTEFAPLGGSVAGDMMRGYVHDNGGFVRAVHIAAYANSGKYYEKTEWKNSNTRFFTIGALLVKDSVVTTAVSEPASLGLIGLGLIGIAAFSRRRRLS